MKKKNKKLILRITLWVFLILMVVGMSAGAITIFLEYFL